MLSERDRTIDTNLKPSMVLILSGKNLKVLPKNFVNVYKSMKEIYLDNNQLSEFPRELCQLDQLEVLTLNSNRIQLIPKDIENLSALERLELANNTMTCLSPAVERLIRLKHLAVSRNCLTYWPKETCKLVKLQVLHVHGNKRIRFIPAEFYQLTNLTEFGFDWFLYLSNSSKPVVRDNETTWLIDDVRDCCKFHHSRGRQQISFLEFMGWLNKIETKHLLAFKYPKGRTPLHLASIWGHAGIVQDIAEAGLDLAVRDGAGETALLLALKHEQNDVVRFLMKASKDGIEAPCGKYGSVMNYLVGKKKCELAVEVAASCELSKENKDANGNNVFHYIFIHFDSDPVKLKELFDIMVKKQSSFMSNCNKVDMTPLHCAAMKNQTEAIRLAVEYNKTALHGFDFNAKEGKHGMTVLHFAALHMNFEMISLILENTNIDVFAKNGLGYSARQIVGNNAVGKLLQRYEKNKVFLFLKRTKNNADPQQDKPILQKPHHTFSQAASSGNRNKDEGINPVPAIPMCLSLETLSKNVSTVHKLKCMKIKSITELLQKSKAPSTQRMPTETAQTGSMNSLVTRLVKIHKASEERTVKKSGHNSTSIRNKSIITLAKQQPIGRDQIAKSLQLLIHKDTKRYIKYRVIYYILTHSPASIELVLNTTMNKREADCVRAETLHLLECVSEAKRSRILKEKAVRERLEALVEAANLSVDEGIQTTGITSAIKINRKKVLY
eukprot:TRINITY_DN14831_c0_g1_i2.p1 TRINITY_DN14831_c0_g1~~TRINITY_DN14831_c0_g1_i2.p1  ORF type:complete len:725 (+),score=157.86 TRINITY_DN14831_c0_g1_i2:323-2497(+)